MKGPSSFFHILFLLLLFLAGAQVFAFGAKDAESKIEPINSEWTLCITAPDVSALPRSRQITGTTIMRTLANTLSTLSFRLRGEEEEAFYRDYAWAKSRSDAARALATKRNERDQLLFRGDPPWRYEKNLKTVNAAIVNLEQELARVDALAPVVEVKPAFVLSSQNLSGSFPAAPSEGGEYRFCMTQRADAFLTATLNEYYGRVYLKVRLYVLYEQSYTFEDSILFSSEDLNDAIDEISNRLVAAVSENFTSVLLVHVEPDDSMVLVDGALVGIGGVEAYTRSPGNVEVEAYSDNHYPISFPLELNPGELAELYLNLTPTAYSAFDIDVPGSPGAKVFLGGLYVGDAPLTLEVPSSEFAYISVETEDGEVGAASFKDETLVKGNAKIVRKDEESVSIAFNATKPVLPGENPTMRARRGFYGAYGALWVVLPISMLASGFATTYIWADQIYAGSSGADFRPAFYQNMQYAAYGVIAASVVVSISMFIRYLYVSGKDATPIVKWAEAEK